MPGTILCTGEAAVSKTDKVFAHQGLIRDRMGSQTINKEAIKANFRR